MKIATWNVNSIRTRLDHILTWLEEQPVDVLCVQETKVEDKSFPRSPLEERGYSVYISGQKSYNGVALISKFPLSDVSAGFVPILGESIAQWDEQKRVITGMAQGVRIVNLYVPNGGDVSSEKYQYKLQWLAVLQTYLKTLLAQDPALLVCGDFNVAPEDRDIYDPTGKEKHIMATLPEREALQQSVISLGFSDALRQFYPDGGLFSWWDYRTGGFPRNRGWRIDHHYLSPALSQRAVDCTIDRTPRGWEKPSDHTPVIVELQDEV